METDEQSKDGVAEGHETVETEPDCEDVVGLRATRNNPFWLDEADKDPASMSGNNETPLDSESVFPEVSTCRSEADSIDLKVGEALVSSMMTSGIEVLDSSDIEIIREDRGSADSIEILESSVPVTSGQIIDSPANILIDETLSDTDVLNFYVSPEQYCSTSPGVNHSSLEAASGGNATHDECDTSTLKLGSNCDIQREEASSGHATHDSCDTTTPKSGSNHDIQSRGDTPVSNTSDSSPSGAHPNVCYSKLQESSPSSYSPSPYDSPTHNVLASSQSHPLVPSGDTDHPRPDSLNLPRPLQLCDRQRFAAQKESYSSLSEYSSRSGSMDALIEAVTSTPLHAQGTVSVEGEMTTFIAHGINELIKKSRENPAANWVNEVTPRSRSSSSISSTTSGWSASVASRATRSPSSVYTQSPDDIPPIDPKALFDVEMHARKVAESLDSLMQGLTTKLRKMSTSTCDCLDVYKEAVDKTCDSVDANIKSMYALMAKCEELIRTMKPVYHIQDQIKEIKRLLDLFETQVSDDEP